MSHYLVDTSAWNRGQRSQTRARWFSLLAEGNIAICPPVALELLYGARGKRDYGSLRNQLEQLPSLPLDEYAAHIATRTQAALAERSQHRGATPVDLLVAAIAQINETAVLHYDRHFEAIQRVTGQPMEWIAPRGSLD